MRRLPVTEIAWDAGDALPFPVCVSVKERPGLAISVLLGNIVLADHGRTVLNEALGSVPKPRLQRVAAMAGAQPCAHAEAEPIPPRFRPALGSAPLTQGFDLAAELDIPLPNAEQDDSGWLPASALLVRNPYDALPQVTELTGKLGEVAGAWTPRRDLLGSSGDATDFVVETENDGRARLRFGDDLHARRPDELTAFQATYRVGTGTAGNVGAGANRPHRHQCGRCFRSAGEPDGSARRDRPGGYRGGTARRSRGLPDAGTRGHRSRLRRRGAAPGRCAARRRDVPLDRQLAHGLRHRRPVRRRCRRCPLQGEAAASPRTLPHGRL